MDILRKYSKEIDEVLDMALKEDIGAGDITTEMIIPDNIIVKGSFMAKAEGILCGLPVVRKLFQKLDKDIKMDFKKKDGDFIKYGDIVAIVRGKARPILTGERLALNILQRLSGVATITNKFVQIIKPYKKTKILDTRKTTPNLRILEKYAVRIGGGENHRMGLYDAVLIKDNHLKIIGDDLERKYIELRRFIPKNVKIEIEVHNIDFLERVIKLNPDIIMLDNMCLKYLDEALAKIKELNYKGKIEVSGGVNLSNVRDIAMRGVDYISVGLITHSPDSLDISFKIIK
ncbi:MAG: carboxylating nicotinate-nucleotide diphosphorylase [Candidatus Goldbacteria bacterium]|nr:carboxylating nicotinate-nucleotide diphosphorylase [Candidatus Goldiibacteriota bacterium]